MNIHLTEAEAYALQGIILGLQGLTKGICRDYGVDNMQLLRKLQDATDRFIAENCPT